MEYLRLDRSFVGGINANQVLMLVIAALSAGWLIWRHREGLFGKKGLEADGKASEIEESEN
jgi:hypothetical protein